jgi:O-antigen ligase
VSGTPRTAGNTHPILFGNLNMLMASLLILFSALATHEGKRWRLVVLILAAVPLFTWITSGSRGSLLALPVLGLLLVLLRKDAWHRGLLVVGVIVILMTATLVARTPSMQQQLRLNEVGQDMAQAQAQNYKTSIGARLVMWEAAWKMFQAHPVIGVGHRGYKLELKRMQTSGEIAPIQKEFGHAHSDVMHMLATGGLVGLLAYIGVSLGPLIFFWKALRKAQSDVHQRLYAAAGLLVSGSFVCFGLTEAIFIRTFACVTYSLLVCVFAAQLLPRTVKPS